MKKLTLVLVALLLALACVFAACGKKNDTPTDTNPKPVDDNPAVVEPTVAKEDLVKIAEDLKVAAAANYVDLYSAEVANAIETEKSNVLAQIYAASTKEEAQKIADNFIIFLKAQKTSYDVLKELVAKIGDVALADEDAVKEAKAYKAALDDAFAGTNAAKKAVLDAYNADKETQETVKAFSARLAVLKEAKAIAAAKKDDTIEVEDAAIKAKIKALLDKKDDNGKFDDDSVNLQIAATKEDFTKEGKTFKLTDVNAYEANLKLAADIAAIYEIEVGSDAYNEIFDAATLAECKAIIDAAIVADPVLVAMKNVIDASATLEAAAEAARWKEYVFVDKNATATEYATKEAALEAKVKEADIIEVESIASKATATWTSKTAILKLALKDDIKTAKDAKDALLTKYAASKLKDYGYADPNDVVKTAVDLIDSIEAAYDASVAAADDKLTKSTFDFDNLYVDVDPAAFTKAPTYGVYTGFTANPKKDTYKNDLVKEIDKLKDSFKTEIDGNKTYIDALVTAESEYDYSVTDSDSKTRYFDLSGSQPAVKYLAWTYAYQLAKKGDLATAQEFKAEDVLNATTYAKAEDAIKWLRMYIGEGEYADKYELVKDYGLSKDLIMVDQAVTEIATAGALYIDSNKVEVAKSDAVEAKVLSPYTVAKALIAEQEKIDAAKKEAVAAVKAAALALREAGDADAIEAANALYTAIGNGSYLNKKLYDNDAKKDYLAVDLSAEKVVIKEKTAKADPVEKPLASLINDADTALGLAKALASTALPAALTDDDNDPKTITTEYEKLVAAQAAVDANADFVALYDLYIEAAKTAKEIAAAGYAVSDKIVGKTVAEEAEALYNKVVAIKDLLINKDGFEAANNNVGVQNKYLDTTGDVDATIAKLTAVLDDVAPAKVPATIKANATTLKAQLAKIAKGTEGYSDLKALKTLLADAQKKYAEEVAAFKGFAAVKATDANKDKAAVAALIANVEAFAQTYNADYLNLTFTRKVLDDVFTFDALTEAYREKEMVNAYSVVEAVLTYANTKATAAKTALKAETKPGAKDSWELIAYANVDAQKYEITVTSIAAATEAVKNFALSDTVYDLDEAVRVINVHYDPDIDLDTLKAGIK